MTMFYQIKLRTYYVLKTFLLAVESLCFYLLWSPKNILDNEEDGTGLNFCLYIKTQSR